VLAPLSQGFQQRSRQGYRVTRAVVHPEVVLTSEGQTQERIALEPVARVMNDVKEPGMHQWKDVVSTIEFKPGFEESLDTIDDFSHILVLFWMHRSPQWDRSLAKTHPQRRADLPPVGVFATRSPVRPNPLGMSVVELAGREGNVLTVKGLDAIDGTPVVDVKPYLPGDSITDARVPEWVHRLRHDASD